MPVLLVMFCCLLAGTIKGQPCADYVTQTNDNTGVDLYAFTDYIDINDRTNQFRVYGFIWNETVVVTLAIARSLNCFSETDIIRLKFSDGIETQLTNFLPNCQRSVVLQLKRDQTALKFLLSKDLHSISVESAVTVHALATIDAFTARRLRMSLKCITELLEFLNPKAIHERGNVSPDSIKLFNDVEQPPEFIGGYDAMWYFLSSNLKPMPDQNGQATLMVSFIIDKTGYVKDPRVVNSISPEIDAEGLRVVRLMPPWKPGRQQGKNVSVKFVLPIRFN